MLLAIISITIRYLNGSYTSPQTHSHKLEEEEIQSFLDKVDSPTSPNFHCFLFFLELMNDSGTNSSSSGALYSASNRSTNFVPVSTFDSSLNRSQIAVNQSTYYSMFMSFCGNKRAIPASGTTLLVTLSPCSS